MRLLGKVPSTPQGSVGVPGQAAGATPGGSVLSTTPRLNSYWDGVGDAWSTAHPHRLWREFTDRQQRMLISRWLTRGSEGVGGRATEVPTGATVLKTDLFDEVAGDGLVAALGAAGLQVTAVDISTVMVAEATARNRGLQAVVADIRCLPMPDSTFDAIFSGSTLDHFQSASDIGVALVELRRVLRPGGRLLLTMDNPANPLIRLRNGPLLSVFLRCGVVPYEVGVALGPHALIAAVSEARFDVVEATAVMHCPRVVAVVLAGVVGLLPRVCRDAFLGCLAFCERLEALPTRWLTGHYIAICAVVPSEGLRSVPSQAVPTNARSPSATPGRSPNFACTEAR